MIRLQVQLTEEQVERLREVSRHRKVSLAALVREGIDLLLRGQPYLSPAQQRERLLSVAGKYRDESGATDVSERHDEYLAEAILQRFDADLH
jgi:hypothetical protein